MDLKRFEKALQHLDRGKLKEARKIFSELASGEEDSSFRSRCRSYVRQCDMQESLNEEAEGDPYARAVFLANNGRHDAALEILTRLLKASPRDDGLLFTQACVLAASGRDSKALETLKAAVILNPENRVHAMNHADFEDLKQQVIAL